MPRPRSPYANVPAAARVHKPLEKTAERRDAILRAATNVFATRGYNNASLVEIAEQAGMTHSGVIHHFGSKEQLLIAVLELRDDADVVNFENHVAPKGSSFLAHLVATARTNILRAGIVQGYTVLSSESVTEDHPAQAFFRERFAGLRRMVIDALNVVTEGRAPSASVERAASAIIATMDGLQVQWLLDPPSIDMPETLQLTIDSIVARLKAESA